MLIVASHSEASPEGPAWGHGGWLMPVEREALDWATLARLSGWDVRVETRPIGPACRWLVIADDPDQVDRRAVNSIRERIEREAVLIVTRAPVPGTPLAKLTGITRSGARFRGSTLEWTGPGVSRTWRTGVSIDAEQLAGARTTSTWATLGGGPAILARNVGRGVVATLAFHPSVARDSDGAGTALLRHLLLAGALAPVAWLDLERVMVLRMDDPGSAEAALHRSWAHPRLQSNAWSLLGDELARRDARMSIGYVAGWVDDGDETRGHLEVDGRRLQRTPGRVHPSTRIRYSDLAGAAPGRVHDLAAQARAIAALRRRGVAEVELHGFTHVHPDRVRWARDELRYELADWYRELHVTQPGVDSLSIGLKSFEQQWGSRPTTVIPPGDAWSTEAMQRALDLGFELFASYYLAIRDDRRWWWSQHVCSPYLDLADSSWFAAGLPVVGYFHERDLALYGVQWFADRLIEWEAAGARAFIDYRRLSAMLACRPAVERADGQQILRLRRPDGAPRCAVPVGVNLPAGGEPIRLTATSECTVVGTAEGACGTTETKTSR